MIIRKAHPNDAAGIAKVQVDSWRTTYKGIVPDDFLQQLSYEKREEVWREATKSTLVFVAEEENGQIVGFICGGKERSGKYEGYDGELYAIYILKEYQDRGIGTLLVKELSKAMSESGFRSMIVLVLDENPATYFYEALGGKLIGYDEIEIGGMPLKERVYGWRELRNLLTKLS